MTTFEGDFSPPSGRFAIVVARFNSTVTEALLAGCRDGFIRLGIAEDRLDVAWVPGSFEIPLVSRT
ncbi:6,7-dimethyl-8-ribityllumazine synthase, partial [Singulisphaera rosea]